MLRSNPPRDNRMDDDEISSGGELTGSPFSFSGYISEESYALKTLGFGAEPQKRSPVVCCRVHY
jgi:hypothetical protein